MKNNKGITLASLVLTIIVLLILASIFVFSGVNTVRYTKYNKAKSEISVIQTNVNSWYQELKNLENTDEYKALQTDDEKQQYKNNFLDDKGYGVATDDPACSQKKLDKTLEGLNDKGIEIENFDNYRYLSSTFLENKIGLNVSFDYLANIEERDVILFGGLEYNGEWYYTMEDFGLTNITSNTISGITFDLAQGSSTNIIISDLKILDDKGNESDISKFRVYVSEDSGNWRDITSEVRETIYHEKKAYLISGLEYKTYYIKISTVDNNLYNQDTIVIENHRAIFKTGGAVNAKMKQLAGNSTATYETVDTNITAIRRADTIDSQYITVSNKVSTDESKVPIYMWYDSGTIWYYTEDDNPSLNENSNQLFRELRKVENIEISTFDTTKVLSINRMFQECRSLRVLDLSNFNTSKVTSMQRVFAGDINLINLDISSFDTSKVEYMDWMFSSVRSLSDLDISNFDTREVRQMNGMFYNCNGLTTLELNNFDTLNVNNMTQMFCECNNLTNLDITSLDTNKVKDMSRMFDNCNKLLKLDISNFDMTKVTDVTNILNGTTSLTELKTPKTYPSDTSVIISLPKTLYDSNNNPYTTLTSTSPTQTWLKDNI